VTPGLTTQEQEAIRWARQLAKGADLRSIRSLSGARFAALIRLQGVSGIHFLSLEGFRDREALIDRVKPGATVGEEVLGGYEVRGGRPVTITTDASGQIVLRMGDPRPGAHPISPERMIRQAQAQAAEREKSRPRGPDRRGGPGRPGGAGGVGGAGGPRGRS
jgi:hypothetical protein